MIAGTLVPVRDDFFHIFLTSQVTHLQGVLYSCEWQVIDIKGDVNIYKESV